MTEKKTKEPDKPYPLHSTGERIRVCGRWQKIGYEPSAAEVKAWKQRCKDRNLDPKTGKPIVEKPAASK